MAGGEMAMIDDTHAQTQARPIVTLKHAKAQQLKRYFTGEPCKNGHIAERLVVNHNCVECSREKVQAHRQREHEAQVKEWEQRQQELEEDQEHLENIHRDGKPLSKRRGPDGLTDQQREFAKQYVLLGGKRNGAAAARAAGYSVARADRMAYDLLQNEKVVVKIHEYTRKRIGHLGALGIAVIAELAVGARSETVRYQAAADLADRAGHKLPQVIEVKENYNGDELDKRIATLLSQLSDGLDPAVIEALKQAGMDHDNLH